MKVSVVIPALNEEPFIARAVESVDFAPEVVVVDGGSSDRTREIARRAGALLLESNPGRGLQMNRGVRLTSGELLLFLHADCAVGPGAAAAIAGAFVDPSVVGGYFAIRIDSPRRVYRLVEFGSNLRARRLSTPYGDQGLVVRRAAFEAVGGYREVPLLEDVDLVRRLRSRGRWTPIEETITTSCRHWQRLGPALTTLLNWWTLALFWWGVPPSVLAPLYLRLRGTRIDRPPIEREAPSPG
jgi:rSAM/selenodomain-associated transferase 2